MLYVKMVPDLADEMQLQMDLHTKSQKKAQTAILDIALFYILKIRKKLLEPMAGAEALPGTEPTLQAVAKAEAQATMLNILLAVEI